MKADKTHNISIRRQLFLVMSALCVALILAQSGVMFLLYYNKLVSEYAANIVNYTRQNASLFNAFTRKTEECMVSLSNDESVYSLVTSPLEDTADAASRAISMKRILIQHIVVPMFNYASRYTYTFYANADTAFAKTFEGFSPNNIVLSEHGVKDSEWFRRVNGTQGRTLWFTRNDEPGIVYAGMEIRYSVNTVSIIHVGTLLMRFPSDALLQNGETGWYTDGTSLVLMESGGSMLSRSLLPGHLADHLQHIEAGEFDPPGGGDPVSAVRRIEGADYILGAATLDMGWLMATFTPMGDLRSRSAVFLSAMPPITVMVVLAVFFVSYFASRTLSRPLRKLTDTIASIGNDFQRPIDSAADSRVCEIRILHSAYDDLLLRIRVQMEEIYQRGQDVKQAELRALQAQINPHFLYNTLDSISWAALDLGDSSIPRVISSLSKLLRYSIREPDRLVMISEEIDMVQHYIGIQEFCYGLTVRLRWDGVVQPTLYLPKLTLQPLFENAILHGMNARGQSEGEIIVRTRCDTDRVAIAIENKGEADIERMNHILEAESDPGKNGIRNVHYRLQALFGGSSGLSFRNTADGTFIATITIERAAESR